MGQAVMPGTVAARTLRISLHDPGMTALHRVGLGGLWLTLEALGEYETATAGELRKLGGDWSLDPSGTALTFTYTGDGKAFFTALVRAAFRTTPAGLIDFAALPAGSQPPGDAVVRHDALLQTFLQHGMTRGAEPGTSASGSVSVQLDDREELFRFRRVSWYNHQLRGKTSDAPDFNPRAARDVAGWLFPGGASRHQAFDADSKLTETSGQWLALLFAPVGAIYFQVKRSTSGLRPQYCLALLDAPTLPRFATMRRHFVTASVREFVVAGAAEAAVRVMATLAGEDLVEDSDLTRCLVTAFGVVPWSSQQKSRLEVFEVGALRRQDLDLYRLAHQLLPVMTFAPKPPAESSAAKGRARKVAATTSAGADESEAAGPRWAVNPLLDLIARNTVEGRPWYRNFAGVLADLETRKQFEIYNNTQRGALSRAYGDQSKGGLAALVRDGAAFDEGSGEAIVVRACHAAWRQRMGALAERARERGESFGDLVNRERERLRVDFAHCKNAATLRAVLVDFWARGGPNRELQEVWPRVLPRLKEETWQETRDLALLALVSYAPTPQEQRQFEEAEPAEAGSAQG